MQGENGFFKKKAIALSGFFLFKADYCFQEKLKCVKIYNRDLIKKNQSLYLRSGNIPTLLGGCSYQNRVLYKIDFSLSGYGSKRKMCNDTTERIIMSKCICVRNDFVAFVLQNFDLRRRIRRKSLNQRVISPRRKTNLRS